MSRQTQRAAARRQAKVNNSTGRVAARAALRKQKGLTPLSTAQTAGYPESRYVPVQPAGKSYPFSSKRQAAKYSQMALAA